MQNPFSTHPTRRSILRAGTLALGGLGLADLCAQRAHAGTSTADTSVILLYLHGGPSHLETYDLKMKPPAEYRSVFKPISTNVAGMEICELFPKQAKIADKFSLIRSLNHDVNIHSDGGIVVLTGKRPTVLDVTSTSKSEHPDFGSITSHHRGFGPNGVPPYIAIPRAPYMTRPTYLGQHHAAFAVNDPQGANSRPPELVLSGGRNAEMLSGRRQLLADLDRKRKELDGLGQRLGIDDFRAQAFDLLTSSSVAEAFNLSRESEKVRDRYGRHLWGQACLLARRLAVAGTGVVSLFIDTPKTGPEFTNWDDHIMNAGRPGHFADFMRRRLPYMDEALSALIEDIYLRGLDRRIMVVVVGEFGRTPRLSTNANGTGRDHWPQAYSALVSGGGLRMGQVIGSTNSKGEFPSERPYTPQDLLAVIYRHLRIEQTKMLADSTGKPIPVLYEGKPIPELG